MSRPLRVLSFLSLLCSGAIFGFFYAWVCSTMWGLDSADPRVAIQAMQAMNASVRNVAFAPAFFGTPLVLLVTAALAWRGGHARAGAVLGAAAVIYLVGGLGLTLGINVPMNEALGRLTVPQDPAAAASIWQAYSSPWQFWNTVRTVVSGVVLLLTGYALMLLAASAAGRAAVAAPASVPRG